MNPMIKKEQYGLLFIVLGSIALNFLNSPIAELFFDDKEIFRYVGLVIYKGGVPYRDVFDHKPPLIYFFNAFNWYGSPWIPWLLDTLLVLFATILFYWLCKKSKLSWPWFLPAIFNLLIRYSLVSFGNGLTREYTAIFLLIFFCVMQGNAKYKYFLLGLLTGLTAWMQQDALITLAPFLFYSLSTSTESIPVNAGKKILNMTTGFLAVSIPLLFYFFSHKSFSYLWEDAFLINLRAPGSQPGIFEKIKNIKHALHEVEFEMAFYTALILGVAGLFLKNKNKKLLYVSLLALIFSFSAEFLTGRMKPGNSFVYYLEPLAATIPILVWVIFTGTQVTFLQDKMAQLIFSFMLSVTLFLGTLRFASGFRISGHKTTILEEVPGRQYLQSQSLSDYQLFVFDDSNLIYLYNHFKILAPSRWIYHYFWGWSDGWDSDNKIFHTILQDLQSHKTRFILDCSGAKDSFRTRSAYTEWQNFLQTHYMPIARDSSNRVLWRIQ
jgi:hypothetical protein